MLPKIGLAVVLIGWCVIIYAQSDSLTVTADSLTIAKAEKAEIVQWLNLQKEKAMQQSPPLQADWGDYYHNGYFHIGRPNLAMPYRLGFQQPANVFTPALYHSYFASFYPRRAYYHATTYDTEPYPFEPALSSIDAAIGDYEHHYAKVSFAKGMLFSFPGLSYQGDLLVQNGWWSDIMSAETSMKHALSLEQGQWKIDAEYAAWAKDIAMTELLPVYWLSTNFSIAHQIKQAYLCVQYPLGKLSLVNASESASASIFHETLKSRSTQVQYAYGKNLGNLSYEALYEHAWHSGNTSSVGAFDVQNYSDKLGFLFELFMPVGFSVKSEYLDFERGKLYSELSIPIRGSYLGAFGNLLLGSDPSPVKVRDIYSASGELELIDLSAPREQGLYLRYEWQGVSSLAAAGTKLMKQRAETNGFDLDHEQLFVRMAFQVRQTWRNWELIANPKWIYSKYDPGLCESPEFRFSSMQNLIYHLPYHNALVAGFGVQSHSGYYAANVVNPNLIEASTVLDAWGGFNLDHWFELRAGVKNILSSSLYGVYPVPLSVFAQLKWYYLN